MSRIVIETGIPLDPFRNSFSSPLAERVGKPPTIDGNRMYCGSRDFNPAKHKLEELGIPVIGEFKVQKNGKLVPFNVHRNGNGNNQYQEGQHVVFSTEQFSEPEEELTPEKAYIDHLSKIGDPNRADAINRTLFSISSYVNNKYPSTTEPKLQPWKLVAFGQSQEDPNLLNATFPLLEAIDNQGILMKAVEENIDSYVDLLKNPSKQTKDGYDRAISHLAMGMLAVCPDKESAAIIKQWADLPVNLSF